MRIENLRCGKISAEIFLFADFHRFGDLAVWLFWYFIKLDYQSIELYRCKQQRWRLRPSPTHPILRLINQPKMPPSVTESVWWKFSSIPLVFFSVGLEKAVRGKREKKKRSKNAILLIFIHSKLNLMSLFFFRFFVIFSSFFNFHAEKKFRRKQRRKKRNHFWKMENAWTNGGNFSFFGEWGFFFVSHQEEGGEKASFY